MPEIASKRRRCCALYPRFFKRVLDVVASALALIVLSPILLTTALVARVKLGSPVLFKQERVGFKGRTFHMIKFRTMLPPQTLDGKVLTDEERLECVKKGIETLSDDKRLTKFGRFLRATSLDELPELWNIFVGDMSFVGPRPLVKIYLPYYTQEEMRRHDVKPGLTGMAQVHGRNSASWKERFRYDVYYADHCSFALDVKILFQTVLVVLKREDVGQGKEKPIAFNVERQKEWDEANADDSAKAR